MKVKIEYEYLPDRDPCFWVKSDVSVNREDIRINTAGFTWNEARRRHIEKLQRFAAHQAMNIPKTEEIEL